MKTRQKLMFVPLGLFIAISIARLLKPTEDNPMTTSTSGMNIEQLNNSITIQELETMKTSIEYQQAYSIRSGNVIKLQELYNQKSKIMNGFKNDPFTIDRK